MKSTLNILLFLFFSGFHGFSQDKLFLRTGTYIPCKIIAISENTISYKDTVTDTKMITLSKNKVLLAEYQSGEIYVFELPTENKPLKNELAPEYQSKEMKLKEWKEKERTLSDNILGINPLGLMLGRLSFSYERLFANKTMGIKIPLCLTYDPLILFPHSRDSAYSPSYGLGFITGLDLNYYFDIKPKLKYFFGPRIRYGTDMMFNEAQGLTVQMQQGFFRSRGKFYTNTFSFGLGFLKLSKIYTSYSGYGTNKIYPSVSLTWRIGFRL